MPLQYELHFLLFQNLLGLIILDLFQSLGFGQHLYLFFPQRHHIHFELNGLLLLLFLTLTTIFTVMAMAAAADTRTMTRVMTAASDIKWHLLLTI